jgi:hypothetical protein
MASGQKSQTQQQTSNTATSANIVNPFQFAQLQGNYGNAQGVAAGLATPYSGAGRSPRPSCPLSSRHKPCCRASPPIRNTRT